jgi:hypothetical protein
MNWLNERQLQVHIPVVAWLMIVGHSVFLLIAAFVFALLTGIGFATGDQTAAGVLGVVGTTIGLLLAVLGLPGLAAGIGLLARKAWARYLAIVIAVLGMANVPVGTLIGLCAAAVLLQDEASAYFGERALPAPPAPATA